MWRVPCRPVGLVGGAAATSAGDGPGRWRAGPSAAAPAKVRGGGVGGRRPGFGDTDVAENPPWTGSRRPGRGPPHTASTEVAPRNGRGPGTPPAPRLSPAAQTPTTAGTSERSGKPAAPPAQPTSRQETRRTKRRRTPTGRQPTSHPHRR